MTKTEIIEKVNNLKKQLLDNSEYENKSLNRVGKFIKENQIYNYITCFDCDLDELFLAVLYSYNTEIDINVYGEYFKKVSFSFNDLLDYQIDEMLKQIEKTTKKILSELSKEKAIEEINKYHPRNCDDNYMWLISLNIEYPTEFKTAINTIFDILSIRGALEDSNINMRDDNSIAEALNKINFSTLPKKYVNKAIKNTKQTILKDLYNASDAKPIFEHIISWYENEKKSLNVYKREKRKQAQKCEEFIHLFSTAVNKKEITNFSSLIFYIPDEKLQKEILDFIYSHNEIEYKQLENDYIKLSEDTILNYKVILNNYNIDASAYDIEDILKYDIETLKLILESLKSIYIEDSDIIIKILKSSDIKSFNEIFTLVKKEIISSQFIIEHPEIFETDSYIYKNVLKIVNFFVDLRINPLHLSNNQNVLLIDFELLSRNLNILSQYNLLRSIKSDINYMFLYKSNLSNIIDLILELGFEEELVSNINLLNIDEERWKRVILLKNMNMPIKNYIELISILDNEFFISDKDIDKYIYTPIHGYENMKEAIDNNLLEQEILEPDVLKKFIYTSLTYKINGVLISRNRVIRNYSKISSLNIEENEKIIASIFCNSNFNEDEIKNIKDIKETFQLKK